MYWQVLPGFENDFSRAVLTMRDVSIQQQTLHAVSHTNFILNEAEDLADLGSFYLDITAGTVSWSAGMYRLLEVDPAGGELSVEGFLALAHPADRDQIKGMLIKPVLIKERTQGEFRLLTPGRPVKILQYTWQPVLDSFANPMGLLGAARDITRQRQAEETRRASEERFRTLIEKAPVAIGIARNGITTYNNPAYLELFGFTDSADLSGHVFTEQVAPQCRAEMLERAHRRALGLPVETVYETTGLRKDGSQFPLRAAATVIELLDGPASVAFFTDISEQKRLEASLARQRDELQTIMDTAPALIVMSHDPECRLMTTNFFGSAFFQVAPGANVSFSASQADQPKNFRLMKNGQDLSPDEMPTRIAASTGIALSGFDYDIAFSDGSVYNLFGNASPLFDDQGNPAGVVGVYFDISQLKRTQQALRQSEERLKQAVKLARLGIWDWDMDSGQVEWNDEMLPIYGITREQFTGRGEDYVNFTNPDHRPAQLANIDGVFQQGVTQSALLAGKGIQPDPKELCIVHPDGSLSYTLGDAISIVDENGKPLRMLGVTRDITDIRLAEARLRQSTELLQAVFKASPVPISAIDREGRVTLWSPSAESLFGWKAAEVIGQPLPIAPPEKEQSVRDQIREEMDGLVRVGMEDVRSRKDGSRLLVSLSTAPLRDEQGAINGVVAMYLDISEQKKDQEKLALYL